MLTEVKIGNRSLKLKSSAITKILYKNIFGEDPLVSLKSSEGIESIDTITQLAFVMQKQAESANWRDLSNVTKEEYYEWLDSFDEDDFLNKDNVIALLSAYTKTAKISSEQKNGQSRQ